MPFYDYKCPNCEREYSILHKTYPKPEDKKPSCDDCQSLLERKLTTPNISAGKNGENKQESEEIKFIQMLDGKIFAGQRTFKDDRTIITEDVKLRIILKIYKGKRYDQSELQ